MGTLECRNIFKSYKNKKVLNDVSLSIEQGKIYGLIGRNGAGKTTLMSILTAQNPADSGTVSYDGMPVWENRKALNHLCFSREINTMGAVRPNNMKIKDYLEIAETYYPNWDKKKAEGLMFKYHLNRKDKISSLSKGMLSMVTIILGICSGADITILDEPVAGLDVVSRRDFYNLVLEENAKGRGFVISTHIIEEAADVFEDVIIMHEGEILVNANTQNLLSRCVCVSGLAADVDSSVENYEIIQTETAGRKKIVTIFMDEGQEEPSSPDITVMPVTLQNLFVDLCGEDFR